MLLNHSNVTGPKATKCGEITQNKGHYAVQGHSRSPILVAIESPHATSYKLTSYLALFPSYCTLLVEFALSTGVPVFNTLVRGEPLNIGLRSLALKKLEESLYRTVLIY